MRPVVLYKRDVDSRLGKTRLLVGLEKEASLVFENTRFDDQYADERGFKNVHWIGEPRKLPDVVVSISESRWTEKAPQLAESHGCRVFWVWGVCVHEPDGDPEESFE